jgi:DNA repair protein RadC
VTIPLAVAKNAFAPAVRAPLDRLRSPDRLDDRALLGSLLGGPAPRGAALALLEARGLEAWGRLPVMDCLAEARRTGHERHAARLAALAELARRMLGPAPGVELARPDDVVALLHEWRAASREHFVAFYLNARHQLLARELISVGSLSASIVHPREVFAPALERRAAGLIVAHNHPSGDPEPSPEDMAITRRLVDAGTLLGVELLDHVVVAARGFVSLKSRGAV